MADVAVVAREDKDATRLENLIKLGKVHPCVKGDEKMLARFRHITDKPKARWHSDYRKNATGGKQSSDLPFWLSEFIGLSPLLPSHPGALSHYHNHVQYRIMMHKEEAYVQVGTCWRDSSGRGYTGGIGVHGSDMSETRNSHPVWSDLFYALSPQTKPAAKE